MVIVLIVIGSTLIFFGFYQLFKFKRTKGWLKVKAIIDKASIEEVKEPMVFIFYKFYYPSVNYRYEVNDQIYIGDLVSLDKKDTKFLDREKAEKLLSRIALSNFAFCNPRNPRQAVLVNDISSNRKSHFYALVVSGILLISICIILSI